MGKGVAPWREGLLIKITEGPVAGFYGQILMIDDDHLLLVDRATRETRWINVSEYDRNYGKETWFEWIETAKTPIEVLDDLILDWDRDFMDSHWRYQDVVGVLQEAKDRILALPKN